MPAYDNTPFKNPPAAIIASWPTYLWGSWPADTSPTRMSISQVALTTNVATLTVQVNEGNIPAVGSLISVRYTQTNGGIFNVSNVALTVVSIVSSTGAGTVSFALTGANVATTADSGLAIVPQPETNEALSANGASIPAAIPYNDPHTDGSRTVKAVVRFPTVPTACVVKLQSALFDQDSEYTDLVTIVTVSAGAPAGGLAAASLDNGKFYRFNVTGLSGSGTIIAKLVA